MPFRVKHSSFFQFGQNLATKTWPNSGQFPRVAGMFPTFSKLAKIRVRKDSADAGDLLLGTYAGGRRLAAENSEEDYWTNSWTKL